jgi:2-polyprenyl-6-methoxyphenol hydroxylase-like FAD-dependent oxidoreductase
MLLKRDVQVLVAGAGPAGLFTALSLARRGVSVAIVDEQHRTAARTNACALHPRTLEILDEAGLAAPLIAKGQRVEKVAFYEDAARRAEVRYGELKTKFPFLLVVPQQSLEDALEERLKADGLPVHWSHRLAALELDDTVATAHLERLEKGGSGYGVQTSEWEVDREEAVRVPFVVGADGHRSRVRRSLGVEQEKAGEPQLFAVFEFAAEAEGAKEVRVGLCGGKTSVLWPLGQGWWRFGFEIDREPAESRREKSRALAIAGDPAYLDLLPARFEALVKERAPWFEGRVQEIAWSMAIRFERKLAACFGRGPAWLLGDAAHVGPPVAVQSMNAAFAEARSLSEELDAVLRAGASRERLDGWAAARRAEFQKLLSLAPAPQAGAEGFARANARAIGDALPASGEQREALLGQLGLALA